MTAGEIANVATDSWLLRDGWLDLERSSRISNGNILVDFPRDPLDLSCYLEWDLLKQFILHAHTWLRVITREMYFPENAFKSSRIFAPYLTLCLPTLHLKYQADKRLLKRYIGCFPFSVTILSFSWHSMTDKDRTKNDNYIKWKTFVIKYVFFNVKNFIYSNFI